MRQRIMLGVFIFIGLWVLFITQNVQMASAASRPALLVQDVDSPGRQPFQVVVNWINDPTQLGGGGSFTVPAGKRLVIEQVSCQVGLVQGDASALSVSTWVSGTLAAHRFMVNLSPIGGGAYSKTWFVDRLVRIYADPGTTVTVGVSNNLTGDGAGWCTISGYLIDVP